MKTIVGLFDNYTDAEAAVGALHAAGHDKDEVSVFAGRSGGQGATTADATDSGPGVAGGAATGAAVGGGMGLLAGVLLAAIPGVGPILAMGPLAAGLTGMGLGAVAGGLVGALTGAGVPEEHARYYEEGVRRGGTLVTLTCDDADAPQAMSILNRHNPVDIDQRSRDWRSAGWTGAAAAGAQDLSPDVKRSPALSQYHDRSPGFAADRMDDTPISAAPAGPGGQTSWNEFGARTETETTSAAGGGADTAAAGVAGLQRLPSDPQPDHFNRDTTDQARVPVVEENLEVGKREIERGGVRVHTRVEETPVEQSINLREEHVRVERRPVDRPAGEADFDNALRAQTVQVTETAEVPVVAKEARVVEEVVVGKDVSEHTETVRDTVRRTDVDVEQVVGGGGEFDRYEEDFRTNFRSSHPGHESSYDQYQPAYRLGYDLGRDGGGGGGGGERDWSSVESEARRRWEQRNPGTEGAWDKMKDAARYAYDRARSKLNS